MSVATLSPQALPEAAASRGRLLLVSYHFPPVGGARVQRPVKFVKYLEQFGWDTTALVAENPSVPVHDDSLCADFPASLDIRRARTLEPGYRFKQQMATARAAACESQTARPGLLQRCRAAARRFAGRAVRATAGVVLQPDPQILWRPAALKAGRQALREQPHQAVLATAPPWSNLLLAETLAREARLPLILDFRDEWDLGSRYLENSQKDAVSTCVQQRMQNRLLRRADVILATTMASTARLEERCRQAGGTARVVCIYNGFDADDFHAAAGSMAPGCQTPVCQTQHAGSSFRLVYTGTLWNLTTAEPLVLAIEQLAAQQPQLVSRLELQFVGRKTPEQAALLGRLATAGCQLRLEDYCSHHEALARMLTADALCLLLSDVPGAERVVPAKLFEYLATGRDLLAIAPAGETADIVRSIEPRFHCLPSDVNSIAGWLASRLESHGAGEGAPRPPWDAARLEQPPIRRFGRVEETRQLAELLEEVTAVRPSAQLR